MIQYVKHRIILLFALSAIVFAGCTDERIVSAQLETAEQGKAIEPDDGDPLKMGRNDGVVRIPFKATFSTVGGAVPGDDRCGELPFRFNNQEGNGQATHLGSFSTTITFCMNIADVMNDVVGEDGNPLSEGESVPYFDGVGILRAANGDILELTIEGAVLPTDHPHYEFEFADVFVFTGGTGRFDGASGTGITNSFVDFETQTTDHYWSGELILPRGN